MDDANTLTFQQANDVYEILVEHAGEVEDDYSYESFVHSQTTRFVGEYRFMGALGFGGKFRRSTYDDVWYVDCYSEDLNPSRRAIIKATNKKLAEYQKATRV
jgi:hypothetical protein